MDCPGGKTPRPENARQKTNIFSHMLRNRPKVGRV